MNDKIAEQAYRVVIEERIAQLLVNRRWYRTHVWANWTDLRKNNEVELRALVRLARKARKVAAAAPDPMAQFGSFREWSESEKAEAFGR